MEDITQIEDIIIYNPFDIYTQARDNIDGTLDIDKKNGKKYFFPLEANSTSAV